ncbi:diguanylate cyclase domain-containing protein [Variovorax sp. KK3]|uniref:diguanylate cyclase domain-containing protein n=1 Tax=Variovorax sp. KK3 TaxID=1855728 RepID=UPI0015C2F3F9|nr:diguanylate cyclase [Variovorax sp. KK3]
MPRVPLTAPRIAGLLVALLGAVLVMHWEREIEFISRFVPGSTSVGLANPLLFLATAVCLIGNDLPQASRQHPAWRHTTALCIAALILLPMAHLFEGATGIALGVDLPRPGALPSAVNPFPGRLSPNACAAFMLTGLAFYLLRRPLVDARRRVYTVTTVAIVLIGLAGFIGHVLGLETLYKFANFNRILPTTALGLCAIGAGLWALLERSQRFELAQAEQRIKSRSLAVIALVTLGSGIAGFAIMRDTFEQTVSRNLRLTATTNAASLAHAIELGSLLPRTVATRPSVRQALERLERDRGDTASMEMLQAAAGSLGGTLTRAEFIDTRGALVASVGDAPRRPGLLLALANAEQPAWLAWRDGYLLISHVPIVDQGRVVGRLVAEQHLPLFDRLLQELRSVDATSEASICGRVGMDAVCAPTHDRPTNVSFPMNEAEGTMAHAIADALQGQSGVLVAKDARGTDVLAAYSPIRDTGLGLAVNTDVATLYAPLRERLALLAAALVAMISLAIYAQRSQVQPVLSRLVESERRIAAVFDNTTDYVVQTDPRGRVRYMNAAVRRALEIGPDASVRGFDVGQFNTPETNQLFVDTILPAAKAKGVWVGETTVYVANQRIVNVDQMVIAHRGADGRVNLYSSIMRDITDELAVEREQQRQAATLRSVAEAIPAIVAVVGRDGRYRFVNSAFERWSGMARAAIVGHTMQEVIGPDEHARSQAWIDRALAGETVSFEKDYPDRTDVRHLAFNFIPLWLDGGEGRGEVDGFVAVGMDVTSHKQENVRLLQLSQRDPLTGLLNRSGFEAWLNQHGSTHALAILYIDLDRFKQVNDTHGHAVGDQLLQQVAQRFHALVRPTDAVARLGGDEFAIALAGIRDGTHADAIAEKVVASAEPPFEVGGLQLEIGASVGVALGSDSDGGWRALVARADALLYKAKAAGRGRHASVAQQAQ